MRGQLELALFGALPAILAMAYVDRLDAKRPEPRWTLRRVTLAGGVSAIPVVLLGWLLMLIGPETLSWPAGASSSYVAALYMSFVIAAFPEEAAKMASVLLFAWRRPEFDERMDGIVYGAHAGLGFALVENVAYLLLIPASLSEYVAIFVGRAVLAVPGHATWGGIMGYYAARRRFDGRGPGLLGGYLLAVLLHGLYDTWLFGMPVAIEAGHTWLTLGIAGLPVVAYSFPVLIIAGGAAWLRVLARRAIADDDLEEARLAAAAAGVPVGTPSALPERYRSAPER
jgi:protease PrsW